MNSPGKSKRSIVVLGSGALVLATAADRRAFVAAARSGQVEPTGHAVRMDALHLIRAAADMADTIERDAQTASAAQLRRTEEEVTRRQRELQERESEVERFRQESERQRAEMMNNARNEEIGRASCRERV